MHLSKIIISKAIILTALLALPFCAFSAETQTIKIQNQSSKADGYYLEQDKTWSESNCLTYSGNKKINPGESSSFDIKKGCKWGVVVFKIFKVADNQFIGKLGQAYHNGEVTMEISSKCKNNECIFKDLNPQQQ